VGRNIVETIVGALVLLVAGVFVFYAFAKSDRTGPDGYEIVARFGRIDTNAKIVSESLLGGTVVALEPGGDKNLIRANGEIQNTQDSIPLTELIAKFMFGGTGSK
jgi:phospholipid/cholesterol/gamma-HCH transport system substrate-binding protein